MKRRVTIQEIADLAGVSKFAVSRALTGKSGVSEATREMILKAAGELGYFKHNEPKRFSGELRDEIDRKWTGAIVILFPNVRYQGKDSVYWGPVFDGISSRLNQKGIDILTLTEPSRDNIFSLVKPEAIQGIITIGTISTQILLEIGRLNIPVVMVDHADPAFHCDTVFTDNYNSMKDLTTKLIGKGYRKLQFVGPVSAAQSYFERWLAFRATLESYGIELRQEPALIGPEAITRLHKLVSGLPLDELPEVFVCANDMIAESLIDELRKRGLDVPRDCAVTGFDNTNATHPIYGTVNVNKELLGMRAVDQMLWRILNPDSAIERKLLYGDVIIRDAHAYTGNQT